MGTVPGGLDVGERPVCKEQWADGGEDDSDGCEVPLKGGDVFGCRWFCAISLGKESVCLPACLRA